MRIDFHSHILPGVDDGAVNVKESLKLLDMLREDGVAKVVATPHLYLHRHSPDEFLKAREKSAEELLKAMSGNDYPDIVLGAEVYFSPALNNMPLKELCIQGTDYLLLELPYQVFTSAFLQLFANFMNSCDVNIILAHIERYFEINRKEIVNEILSYSLLTQANCDSFLQSRERRKMIKLIENGTIQLLGTDLHSIKKRPPKFGEAERYIRKKLSDNTFDKMMETAEMILRNENLDIILN